MTAAEIKNFQREAYNAGLEAAAQWCEERIERYRTSRLGGQWVGEIEELEITALMIRGLKK